MPATHTVVMEAAFYLLDKGLLDIPHVGGINVKQARALLHMAAWLQCHMSAHWQDEGLLGDTPHASTQPYAHELLFALLGPAGSGKTTVLQLQEALLDHFGGPESVRKCAISNTAARLLGGDTMHALCKLPPHSLQGRRGKLSADVLKNIASAGSLP